MSLIFWYLWKQEIISHYVTNVFIRHGYNSIEPLTIYTRNKPWLYFLHQILSSNSLLLIVEWKVSKHFVKIVETVWKNIMINLTFTSTCLYTSYYIITVNPGFSEFFPLQSEYAPRSLISGNLRTQYVGLSLSRDRISNSDLGSSIKRFTYTLS